jgi:hypothetical protein
MLLLSYDNKSLELNVPKQNIALGFDPLKMRYYTDFTVDDERDF